MQHTCPCPCHSIQHLTCHVFHFQMCLPFRGCRHPDDQVCGCLIPTFHSPRCHLPADSQPALNCIRTSLNHREALSPVDISSRPYDTPVRMLYDWGEHVLKLRNSLLFLLRIPKQNKQKKKTTNKQKTLPHIRLLLVR